MALWDCRKTIVLHDNRWRCDHGWDIDLDDGSSNFHLYNNLCLNGGLKFREGFHARPKTTSWSTTRFIRTSGMPAAATFSATTLS